MPADLPLEPAPPAADWHDCLVFAARPPDTPASRVQRGVIALGVLVLHGLFAWMLQVQSRPHAPPVREDVVVVVDFIATLPPEVIRAPATSPARDAGSVSQRHARAAPRASGPARNLRPRAVDSVPIPSTGPLQLYRSDGSLQLPDAVLADLEHSAGDARQFDFQVPDLELSGRWLERPPVLAYEATRFDEYWQPNDTILDEVLRKAVEKTTKEVRIPIPGAPGRELVCVVSLLAAGGACGVERYGSDIPRPGIDDPATLDASEAAACQAWWDRIVGASTQAEWRRTRKLYDEECRKPLAKELPPPPEPEPEPEPEPAPQPDAQ